jgi:hypothetical protein
MRTLVLASLFLVLACSDEATSLVGEPCPCGSGFICCLATNECLPEGSAIASACPEEKPPLSCTLEDRGDGTGTIRCNDGSTFEVSTREPEPECGSRDGPLEYEGEVTIANATDVRLFRPFTRMGTLRIGDVATSSVSFPCLERVEGSIEISSFLSEVTTLSFPRLREVGGYLSAEFGVLSSIRAPSLESAGGLRVRAMLDELDLRKLSRVREHVHIEATGLRDLDGLVSLREVVELSVSGNPFLVSLGALSKIERVSGLWISENPSLESLNGLSLRAITGSGSRGLEISGNALLRDLTALRSVELFSGSIRIYENPRLMSLAGLERVRFVEEMTLARLPIQNLTGLAGIERLSELSITETAISTLNGLGSTVAVDLDALYIAQNTSLVSLEALRVLPVIEGSVQIIDNPRLASLRGLEEVSVVNSDLSIIDDDALTDLAGLGGLNSIGSESSQGDLRIEQNDGLSSLSGLEALRGSVDLVVRDNVRLTDLSALQGARLTNAEVTSNAALSALRGLVFAPRAERISVAGNDALTDLSALGSITDVFELTISDNPALATLQGLEALRNVDYGLRITGNSRLTTLARLSGLRRAADLVVEGNASLIDLGLAGLTNVRNMAITENNCLPQCIADALRERLAATQEVSASIEDNKLDCLCEVRGSTVTATCSTGC